MPVRVILHGWLKVGVDDPDGLVELTLPGGTDVGGVVELLRETSPMLDPRACLATVAVAHWPVDSFVSGCTLQTCAGADACAIGEQQDRWMPLQAQDTRQDKRRET